jgi:hypothetical protein
MNIGAILNRIRSVSSVGLEHRLDRAGVVGSNPIHSTSLRKSTQWRGFFIFRRKPNAFELWKENEKTTTTVVVDFLIAAAD